MRPGQRHEPGICTVGLVWPNSPLKPHKNTVGALSINARQYISIEHYVAASEPICSSQITADVSTDPEFGIEPDIKQW